MLFETNIISADTILIGALIAGNLSAFVIVAIRKFVKKSSCKHLCV